MRFYKNKPVLDKNLVNYTKMGKKTHYWDYTDGIISFCNVFYNVNKKESYKLFKKKFEDKYNLMKTSYFIGG